MAHSARDVAGFVPSDEVPTWVRQSQIGLYLTVILATIITYDAGKAAVRIQFRLNWHLKPGACTFDKEVG